MSSKKGALYSNYFSPDSEAEKRLLGITNVVGKMTEISAYEREGFNSLLLEPRNEAEERETLATERRKPTQKAQCVTYSKLPIIYER